LAKIAPFAAERGERSMSKFLLKLTRGLRHLEYASELWRCFWVFRRPLRVLAGYLSLPITYPFTCETTAGVKVVIMDRPDLVTTWIIFLRDEYVVRPDDRVIVDCGANIGTFALYAASLSGEPRVVAVEPYPATFRQLRDNVELNGLDGRVSCVAVALSASDGDVNMYAAPEVPSHARQVIRPSGPDTVSVPAVSLLSLFRKLGLETVDLLKMDIEGSEHSVLIHADRNTLGRVKRIALEYHPNHPKRPLFDHMASMGFVVQHDRVLGRDYGVAEFVRREHGFCVDASAQEL